MVARKLRLSCDLSGASQMYLVFTLMHAPRVSVKLMHAYFLVATLFFFPVKLSWKHKNKEAGNK